MLSKRFALKINDFLTLSLFFPLNSKKGAHYRIRKPLGLNESILENVSSASETISYVNNNSTTTTSSTSNTTESTSASTSDVYTTIFSSSIVPNEVPVKNCNKPAILELPSDGFTREERQRGWVIIHGLLACYCFWLLATVCDEYFVPAIEAMCCSK